MSAPSLYHLLCKEDPAAAGEHLLCIAGAILTVARVALENADAYDSDDVPVAVVETLHAVDSILCGALAGYAHLVRAAGRGGPHKP